MAEGWARHIKGGRIAPYSAGLVAKGLDPRAARVMREAGVDISDQASKRLEEVMDQVFDFVITVCGHAEETCPAFPANAQVIHRAFDDPPRLAEGAETEEEALSHYRRVRDEIRAYVEALPCSLG